MSVHPSSCAKEDKFTFYVLMFCYWDSCINYKRKCNFRKPIQKFNQLTETKGFNSQNKISSCKINKRQFLIISSFDKIVLYLIFHRRNFMQKLVSDSKGANYKYSQIFGYKGHGQRILDEDVITKIKFDSTGNFVALGDKAGRIIVFNSQNSGKKKEESYEYFTEYQSHMREFDPLKSMEVGEDIVDIHWLQAQGKYQKLITSNSRSMKIWKMFERTNKKVVKPSGKELNLPKLQATETNYSAELQRSFPSKHLSPINSTSISSNQEYLLTSDQIQIFFWSLEDSSKPYMVADILGKQNIEEVKETITCSKMHPTSDSLFVFGTNKGSLKLGDLRRSSRVDNDALNFKMQGGQQKNYIYEMISSYSSADFLKGGKYLVSRDFLTVKIWDVCNTKKPVGVVSVQESLKGKLCDMVQNECIFDKFSLASSPDNNTIVTGNYNNCFHLIDADGTNTQYELNYKKATVSKPIAAGKGAPLNKMDYERKTIAVDFHPKKNIVAVGSLNCFFVYSM